MQFSPIPVQHSFVLPDLLRGWMRRRRPTFFRRTWVAMVVKTSSNFKTDSDAFVTKLNPSGSGLLFSTLVGGTNDDFGNGIAVDGNGDIAIAGSTFSTDFPTVNAIQSDP